MNANEPKNLPKDLLQSRNRFQTWRSQRPIGSPIPDSLWDLAVKLAGQHGLSFRASVLQLDHYDLKKRTQEDRPQIPSRESFFCPILLQSGFSPTSDPRISEVVNELVTGFRHVNRFLSLFDEFSPGPSWPLARFRCQFLH